MVAYRCHVEVDRGAAADLGVRAGDRVHGRPDPVDGGVRRPGCRAGWPASPAGRRRPSLTMRRVTAAMPLVLASAAAQLGRGRGVADDRDRLARPRPGSAGRAPARRRPRRGAAERLARWSSGPHLKPIRPSQAQARSTAVVTQTARGRMAMRRPTRAHKPRVVGSAEPYRGRSGQKTHRPTITSRAGSSVIMAQQRRPRCRSPPPGRGRRCPRTRRPAGTACRRSRCRRWR